MMLLVEIPWAKKVWGLPFLVVTWIARLGGFLARNHDGFPGVKTLWRGLQRLHDIASTWKLLYSSQNQDL